MICHGCFSLVRSPRRTAIRSMCGSVQVGLVCWVHLAVRFPENAMSNELPTLPCMTLALALVACRDARRSAVFLSLLGCHSPERELITTGVPRSRESDVMRCARGREAADLVGGVLPVARCLLLVFASSHRATKGGLLFFVFLDSWAAGRLSIFSRDGRELMDCWPC